MSAESYVTHVLERHGECPPELKKQMKERRKLIARGTIEQNADVPDDSKPNASFQFAEVKNRTLEEASKVICPLCPPGSLAFDVNDWLMHVASTQDPAHRNVDRDHCRKIVRGRRTLIREIKESATTFNTSRSGSIREVMPAATSRVLHKGPADYGFPCKHDGPDANNAYFLHPTVNSYFEHIKNAHPNVDLSAETLPRLTRKNESVTEATFRPIEFARGIFPCEICHQPFQSELSLLTHLDTDHAQQLHAFPVDPAKSCCLPDNVTVGSSAWHQTTSNDPYVPTGRPISVSCPLCPQGGKKRFFTSEPSLLAHIQMKHANILNPVQALKDIIQEQRNSKYTCTICSQSCNTSKELELHVVQKHGKQKLGIDQVPGMSWYCPHCDKAFSSGTAIHSHMEFKHGKELQHLPCPACRRTFPHIFGLAEHIQQQHRNLDAKPYLAQCQGVPCALCPDRLFLDDNDRNLHLATFHRV